MIYCLMAVFLFVIIGCGSDNPLENASSSSSKNNGSDISFSIEKILSYRYNGNGDISLYISLKVKNITDEPISSLSGIPISIVDKKGNMYYGSLEMILFDPEEVPIPKSQKECIDFCLFTDMIPPVTIVNLKPQEEVHIGVATRYYSKGVRGELHLIYNGVDIPLQKIIDQNMTVVLPEEPKIKTTPFIDDNRCEPQNGAIDVDPQHTQNIRINFSEQPDIVKIVSSEPENFFTEGECFAGDGGTYTIFGYDLLPYNTRFSIILESKDYTGQNVLRNEYSFTTIAGQPPLIISDNECVPPNGAVDVDPTNLRQIKIVFVKRPITTACASWYKPPDATINSEFDDNRTLTINLLGGYKLPNGAKVLIRVDYNVWTAPIISDYKFTCR